MSGMVDPLGESLAALEASLQPASPGVIRTQPIDARLNALKAVASFVPGIQMIDPVGVDVALLGGVGLPPAPAGYTYWLDVDGVTPLQDTDGTYLWVPA